MADGELKAGKRVEAGVGRGFLYDAWYFAAVSSEAPSGGLKRYEILGEPVLIGRESPSQIGGPTPPAFALRDICPHRAAPLSAGKLVCDRGGAPAVECPYHGWTFRTADGACSAIPSLVTGQAMETERIRVRRYPVHEAQGLIFVYMADPSGPPEAEPAPPPPPFPGVVGGAPKLVERMDFEAHIDHAVVGLMDPAHGPYVHQNWWWRSNRDQIEKAKPFEPREQGFAMVAHAPSKNSYAYRILGGAPVTEITFRLPGFRWEHITVGKKQVLALTCLTPVDEGRTRITQLFWSDHWAFTLLAPFVRSASRRFLKQDGDMVNLQNQGLKYDPPLLWIDDADRQAKWYQALKKEWAASRREGRLFVNPVKPVTLRWKS